MTANQRLGTGLVLAALLSVVAGAQEPGQMRMPPPGKGGKPPKSPIEDALDVNGDGVIDADEIANAADSLQVLDENGDGQLSEDELRPMRPPR